MTVERLLEIPLLPAQAELLEDVTSPVISYRGGYGSGKTKAAEVKVMQLATLEAPYPVPLWEPGLKQIEDVIEPELRDLFIEMELWQYVKHDRRHHNFSFPVPGGDWATIHLRNASNPQHIVGRNDGPVLVDEVDLIPRRVLRAIRSRCGRRRGAINQFCIFGTPDKGKRGVLYEWTESKAAPGTHAIVAKSTDNPFLPEGYVDVMLAGYSEIEKARYINGEFVDMSGRVYTMFDGSRHLAPFEVPRDIRGNISVPMRHVMCVDFGAVFTPWIMAAWLYPGTSGEYVHVHDEILGKDTHTLEMTRRASAWWSNYLSRLYGERIDDRTAAGMVSVYCDPAGAKGQRRSASDVHILEDAGFTVYTPDSHDSVSDRVSAMQVRLALDEPTRYMIDPTTAPYAAKCLAEQEYGDDGAPKKGRPREQEGGLDHGADAQGYFVAYEWPTMGAMTYRKEAVN